MVSVMVALASIFFFAADQIIRYLVTFLLVDSMNGSAGIQMMDKRWYIVHAYSNFERRSRN